jgi:hypothetical protein
MDQPDDRAPTQVGNLMQTRSGLPDRILGVAFTLLAAALAVYAASRLLLAAMWFLVGIAVAGVIAAIGWRILQRNRSGW